MLKILNINWFKYHFSTLFQQVVVFRPLRLGLYDFPITFRPGIPLMTFVFASVNLAFIILPIVAFVYNTVAFGNAVFEMFIISLFGLIFSIIYRSSQGDSSGFIVYDRYTLKYILFGFYEKKEETIPKSDIAGLAFIEINSSGNTNYKICAVLSDGNMVLLSISILKSRALRRFNELSQRMGLAKVLPGSGQPMNDISIRLGSGTSH